MEDETESSDNSQTVPNLHNDIVSDIFSCLPVKPLVQFTTVSKAFYSLIQNPHFVNLHLARTFVQKPKHRNLLYIESSQNSQTPVSLCRFDSAAKSLIQDKWIKLPLGKNVYLQLAGSSNGLICYIDMKYVTYGGILFLWNPILGKIKVVTDSPLRQGITYFYIHVGFAFVPEITDYKIVMIAYYSDTGSDVFVYTLRENCWRKNDVLGPCYIPEYSYHNVFVNGSIHWIAYKTTKSSNAHVRIMLFNMNKEVFGELGLPNNINSSHYQPQLSVSCNGDSLSLFYCFTNHWEVWSMKDYGVVESWVKQYTIIAPKLYSMLRFMDNGDILAMMMGGELVFLDPENNKIKETEICVSLLGTPRVVSYVESLGLLNNGDQVGNQV